jgi:hypothetical protein
MSVIIVKLPRTMIYVIVETKSSASETEPSRAEGRSGRKRATERAKTRGQ